MTKCTNTMSHSMAAIRIIALLTAMSGMTVSACGGSDVGDESSQHSGSADPADIERFFEERDLAREAASPGQEQVGADESVSDDMGATEKAGAPWKLHVPVERRWIGGNIEPQDHYWTLGGQCSSGYVRAEPDPGGTDARVNPVVIKRGGYGACDFAGWVNPHDKRDCTARIHAHTNAFWGNVDCETSLFEMLQRKSCCDAYNTPGCHDVNASGRSISECVCQRDPFCCNTAWDEFCTTEVGLLECASRDFCR